MYSVFPRPKCSSYGYVCRDKFTEDKYTAVCLSLNFVVSMLQNVSV